MTEAELADIFEGYFSECDIYREVPFGGYIDFIAVHGGHIRIGVEVKKSLNFKVVEQAMRTRECCHYTYIAVKPPRGGVNYFLREYLEHYGLGLLTAAPYRDTWDVREWVPPRINRHAVDPELEEYMKRSVSGSQNDRMTPFKNTIELIVRELRFCDGKPVKEVLKRVKHHYASISSAQSSLYKWCRSGLITEFRIENGCFYLNEKEEDSTVK